MAIRWVPDMGWGTRLCVNAFHAVSAFNNAGFSLLPTTSWTTGMTPSQPDHRRSADPGIGFPASSSTLVRNRRWQS